MKLLIANRGEIAIRIARAAAELGMPTVAVLLHRRQPVVARPSSRRGRRACGAPVRVRTSTASSSLPSPGTTAATPCTRATGSWPRTPRSPGAAPRPASPSSARRRRRWSCSATRSAPGRSPSRQGVPVVRRASPRRSTRRRPRRSSPSLPAGSAMIIKAVAGGGGRGHARRARAATRWPRPSSGRRSEAATAFGNGDVYVERLVERARHIEVQIAGDDDGIGRSASATATAASSAATRS